MKHSRSCLRSAALVIMGWMLALATLGAQAGNGTLTGTVVDAQGAALPGAVVAVTEEATGAVRTIPSNHEGVFRLAALPPGRYRVEVTMDGFSPLNLTDVSLAPAETKNLGNVPMKLGQLAESVTVTAEKAVVQTATSSRMGTVTSEQLVNIPLKGRDIFGLLTVVPGVQDTNLSRDFTSWTSMDAITINGMPNTSKNVVVDGVSVVDELGSNAMINPNIDAVGEVQVISNGFTAENGRSNGGLIIMTTKSGTSRFKGSAWYNARREDWNANRYFNIKQNLAKPLYHVNIPGYSIGGPIVIPKVVGKGKMFFFGSQEFTDDLRPTDVVRVNYPTALERAGDFSQTYFGNANGPGQGTLQVIINPDTGLPFPGNKIPLTCAGIPGCKNGHINQTGLAMLNLLPLPNDIHNPQPNQYNAANSTYETMPLHSRTSSTFRYDVVLSQSIRGSFKFSNDREDNINNNRFAPGLGVTNNAVPGRLMTIASTQVLSSKMVNEVTVGYARNSYGFRSAEGQYAYDPRDWYRSALGVDPPRLEPFGPYRDPPGLGYDQSDEYPYVPIMRFRRERRGGSRAGLLSSYNPGASGQGGWTLPAANRNLRWSGQDDLSWTLGRHNLKTGVFVEWASKTEPQSVNYMGNYDFTHNAENPFSTGNGYANALIGTFNTYTELTNRVDRDRRHWQTEAYLQDSWRANRRLTLDYGVRLTHSGGYYDARQSTAGFLEPSWDPKQAPRLYRADLHDRRGRQPALRGGKSEGLRRCQSVGAAPERVHRQPGARHRVADQRHGGRRLPGAAAGRVLQVPGAGGRAAGRLRLGHQRQRQAGAARIHRDFLRHPIARRVGELHRRGASRLHPRRPVRDVRRRGELRELEPQLRRDADQRPDRRRRDAIAGEVLQRQRGLPARHRFQHHRRSRLCRIVHLLGRAGAGRQPAGQQPVHPGRTRTRCSTTTQWPPTCCGPSIRAWVRSTSGSTRTPATRSTTTRCAITRCS